jgi:3-(3-hydroxy-phenyl)propionate hydroxylase
MRAGRIFLAGDSAHQMPPFLGQGLCSGIRDAANLVWKLELVAAGRATDDLLDTYSAERLPHAADTVAHAVDTGKLIDHLSRSSDPASLDAAYGGGRKAPRLRYGLVTGEHPLVGRQLPQPTVGGRRLDDLLGGGYALLTRPSTSAGLRSGASRVAPFGRVVELPDGVFDQFLGAGCTIVVRPDRYVAAVTNGSDELVEVLDRVLPSAG